MVDDLPDVRKTLSGSLVDEGYTVFAAASREEALQALQENRFDVAVLDVRLDETDESNREGLQLMHDIKALYPMIFVIMLTGYADVAAVREALQPIPGGVSPAFCFLLKSEISQLVSSVKQAFEQQALENSNTAMLSYITGLIAQGENDHVEFKASMRWDYQQKSTNRGLSKTIAKTIAGMLNNAGGVLLIGVSDDGKVVGIEHDLQTLDKANPDGFQLALTDLVDTHLGLEHMSYIHPSFETISDKMICIIAMDPSPKPVYLNSGGQSEFYLRTGNSTRSLDVKAAIHYIQTHWR